MSRLLSKKTELDRVRVELAKVSKKEDKLLQRMAKLAKERQTLQYKLNRLRREAGEI